MTKPKVHPPEPAMNDGPVLLPDYTGKNSNEKRLEGMERRLHNIETLLWDNRDKYTSSLDIVANRELEIVQILIETRKLVEENRKWYGMSFQKLFDKEEHLEKLLNDTKEMLKENRKIYTQALQELRDQEFKNGQSIQRLSENTPIFLAPNPIYPQINRKNNK